MNQKMVVVWHQAIGQDISGFYNHMVPKLPQKEPVILTLKEDGLVIVASVVEVVVVPWQESYFSARHS
jgi:hypothetical protein